jgi:hypothetical protein
VADRLLREVTFQEWLALPFEVSYSRLDERPERTSAYRYYEIIKPEEES